MRLLQRPRRILHDLTGKLEQSRARLDRTAHEINIEIPLRFGEVHGGIALEQGLPLIRHALERLPNGVGVGLLPSLPATSEAHPGIEQRVHVVGRAFRSDPKSLA